MHPPIESKLPHVDTTIFTVMSRLAADYGAINLSQGFPDFEPPERLLALANQHMHKSAGGRGVGNQYAPMTGLPILREAIAAKVAEYYGANVDPDTDVTVTAGGTEALFCAIQALVRQGDAVILLDPSYDSYEPAVTLAGGHTVRVPLRRPGFGIDWQRLRDAITTARPRLLILNFPHNPSGATLTAGDLEQLASLLRGTGTFVLSDEVYEHMLFDGRKHYSLLTHEELAGRSFVVSSFGKTYHATGWKVGYCIAPPALTTEFRKVHQFVQFVVATPLQAAIADFMQECPEHTRELPAFYQRKRDYFVSLLERTKFRFEPAHSTYFQLVDYSAVSDLPDTEFAHLLTTQHGVAAIPISVFSADDGTSVSTNNAGARSERIIRFCFAKHEATLDAAAERLRLL